MNIGLITARLICDPIRFTSFGNYLTEIRVNFVQSRDYFGSATILADGKVGDSITKFYCHGDYVLIEGECMAIDSGEQKACLLIYATDVQPAHLIIKE